MDILALSFLETPIGLDPRLLEGLLMAIVSLWVEIWYHGEVSNKMLHLDPMQNSSIEL